MLNVSVVHSFLLLGSILLYGFAILKIYSLIDGYLDKNVWIFLAIMTIAAMNIMYMTLCRHVFYLVPFNGI